jgi:hypothetical protein
VSKESELARPRRSREPASIYALNANGKTELTIAVRTDETPGHRIGAVCRGLRRIIDGVLS